MKTTPRYSKKLHWSWAPWVPFAASIFAVALAFVFHVLVNYLTVLFT